MELGIVEGQTDRDDLGQEVKGNEGAMVVINMVQAQPGFAPAKISVNR